jgi:cysteinyl-tRNA synthetase
MKVSLTALITLLVIPARVAFLAPSRSTNGRSMLISAPAKRTLKSSLDEEFENAFNGDDFYAYDASEYESSKTESSNDGCDDRPVRRGRGSGRGRGAGRGGRGRRDSVGTSDNGRRKPKEYLGPYGHDYQLSSASGPNNSKFDESSIHSLLAERLQAKFARDFRTADMIQMELIDGGVFVHDGLKEWRADGIPYGSFNGGGSGQNNPRNIERQVYTKSPHSEDVAIDDVVKNDLITKLVKERTKFKMMREYSKADAVREGLRIKFNVLIDDRLKQWSVGGDFGEEHNQQRELADKFANRGYIKSTSSLSMEDEEEEEYIQFHVEARAQAKKDRKFDAADKIRLDLAQRFDVLINDKLKLWSIGGLFEELGGTVGKPKGVYTRMGSMGDLSPEDEDVISKMITARYHAKKQKAFDVADDLRDELMSKYNVKIDDRSSEWRVDSDDYAMTGSNSLSEEEVEFIGRKLKERFRLKLERQYEDADAIRDRLKEKFGIQIDDRVKEWCVDSLGDVAQAENVTIIG